MAVQTMTIPQFISGSYREEDRIINKFIAHLERHKIAYRVVGTTILIMLVTADVAFAASTGIDAGGRRMYSKLVSVGKWAIIVRGAWQIISDCLKGDFDSAKKSFFSYVLVYVTLLGLPWILDEVDGIFKSEAVSGDGL